MGRENSQSRAWERGPSTEFKEHEGQSGWRGEPCVTPTPSHSIDEPTEAPRQDPPSKLHQGCSQDQKPGLRTLLPKPHTCAMDAKDSEVGKKPTWAQDDRGLLMGPCLPAPTGSRETRAFLLGPVCQLLALLTAQDSCPPVPSPGCATPRAQPYQSPAWSWDRHGTGGSTDSDAELFSDGDLERAASLLGPQFLPTHKEGSGCQESQMRPGWKVPSAAQAQAV